VALVAVAVVAFFGEETRGRPLEAITRPAVSRPGTTLGAAPARQEQAGAGKRPSLH
jgi:hypothetical protein